MSQFPDDIVLTTSTRENVSPWEVAEWMLMAGALEEGRLRAALNKVLSCSEGCFTCQEDVCLLALCAPTLEEGER